MNYTLLILFLNGLFTLFPMVGFAEELCATCGKTTQNTGITEIERIARIGEFLNSTALQILCDEAKNGLGGSQRSLLADSIAPITLEVDRRVVCPNGLSMLATAVGGGKIGVVERLIEKNKADVNYVCQNGLTALDVMNKRYDEIERLYRDSKLDGDQGAVGNRKMAATFIGSAKKLRSYLLSKGAKTCADITGKKECADGKGQK